MRVEDVDAIKIKLASPEDILDWSHGEVTEAETINYRNQKPEKNGLFCERIFGPEKDYQCYCGKYKKIRYKGIVCDRCGVEVTKSSVRRERMGHIKLAAPVSHIWYLRGIPSKMGLVLGISKKKLEKVVYFTGYIVTEVDKEAKERILKQLKKEFKKKKDKRKENLEGEQLDQTLEKLRKSRDKTKEEIKSIQRKKILTEVEYHRYKRKYGDIFKAGTGAETLREMFENIDLEDKIKELTELKEETNSKSKRKKYLKRLKVFRSMQKADIRPEWMFPTVIPVLPPDLRPIIQLDGGRYASSDLNDLYRRVINRNNRLKNLLDIEAPEVIVRNEKRMLQEGVDALIDNQMRKGVVTQASTGGQRLLKSLADMLKGKQGRFRQNLLGKRVDYSGRSVIVVGPELDLNQCGLPKKMALEIFKPFIIQKILDNDLAYNVKGATKMIDEKDDEVWPILEEVVKGKAVLLNRAPTLHRLGIQAFEPVLTEGEAIRIHPMVCEAFNADFDGDQMAVHLPLSKKAQKEAKELMLSSENLLKPATGKPIVSPSQDMVLGCYWITQIEKGAKGEGKVFGSPEEAKLALDHDLVDIRAKVKIRIDGEIKETNVGRIIFNDILPEEIPFQNEAMGSGKLKQVVAEIIKKYEPSEAHHMLDDIKNLGYKYSTLSGISWGMDDLIIPKEKKSVIEEAEEKTKEVEDYYEQGLFSEDERSDKIIEIWTKAKNEIEDLVPKGLPEYGSVLTITDSGSRGSWSQPIQMAGMKGLVVNPSGDVIELPVKSSFKEGFDVLEYFISTHGARKGTVDTALRTASAGYLTRRLVDVSHEVIVTEEDCGDDEGIVIKKEDADELDQDFYFKIASRTSLEDIEIDGEVIVKSGEIIDSEAAEKIKESDIKRVRVRSVMTCNAASGVCQKCYGWELGHNKMVKLGEAVGIVAAQAIGEPGTQLTMRTFHTGGVAGGTDITMGLPRIQEIFEVRNPKGKAEMSEVAGKVIEVNEEDRIVKIRVDAENTKKEEVKSYKIDPNKAIWVERGERVEPGTQLCEGNLDLKKVFKTRGLTETKRHILQEAQKVYVSQGVDIHDKHLEVIVKQMTSRMRVTDPGDSFLTPKQIIERDVFKQKEEKMDEKGKAAPKAEPILLGISKVALNTDSFLSAASFQQTSKVLIEASLEGKIDPLKGLKENVIIGKLIPAGTGFSEKDN
ncbi:MAG: DNA-directed RNA polymerase subunit beta' [Patescibacteria group bacterium]